MNVTYKLYKHTVLINVLDKTARFVTVDAYLVKECDSYVSELENIGLSRYMEIQQMKGNSEY